MQIGNGWNAAVAGLALWACALSAHGQQRDPHAGYIYPAGGQQGTEFEVRLGGQYLAGAGALIVSGGGVKAEVVRHYTILTQQDLNRLRNNMERLEGLEEALQTDPSIQNQVDTLRARVEAQLYSAGIDEYSHDAVRAYRRSIQNPKQQINPAISEYVLLRVMVDPDAETGDREVRLPTSHGLTNPLLFQIGSIEEVREGEPGNASPGTAVGNRLPIVFNGQIMPGEIDRFRFAAQKGQRLVVSVAARKLIPYLADAVPGWFQATLAIHDAEGLELAYADDHFFDPDPVIYFEVPETGDYVVEIKDAIHRGREDFVYRITVGEQPFLSSYFPLGGRAGEATTLTLEGWNLPRETLTVTPDATPWTRVESWCLKEALGVLRRVLFAVDDWPEVIEREPNDEAHDAMPVVLPVILNGRMDAPNDRDLFRFDAEAGETIVADVQARRLGSPLDSLLRLRDAQGVILAVNDDFIDPGAGLLAHHADSRLAFTFMQAGTYYLEISDAQGQGGNAFAYRCRLGPPRPDFELRIVPSSLNLRAGTTTPVTVYAIRRDGFDGDIALDWDGEPPAGFSLGGAWIPSGQDSISLTICAPSTPLDQAISLRLKGEARIEGHTARRPVVPADDMMQAFFYRHMVPAQTLIASVSGRARGTRPPARWISASPVQIAPGGNAFARVRIPGLVEGATYRFVAVIVPEGITVKPGEAEAPDRRGVAVMVIEASSEVAPGLKGNLTVKAVMVRSAQEGEGSAPPRRTALGILPAMPFEIIDTL